MSIKGVILTKDADVRELAARIGKDIGGVGRLATTDKASIVAAINEIKKTTDEAGKTYATKTEVSKLASKAELKKAIEDLINDAGDDNDTLKELADQIEALEEADKSLVSTAETQSFKEVNKEIARNNIGAVSTANFNQAVNEIKEDKASRAELAQTKAELDNSIHAKGQELQAAVDAEEEARKAEGVTIRSEFAQADQELKKAVDAADNAVRGEFAQADKKLKEALSAEDAAIRGEFAQADQVLKQAADAETEARKAEDTAIRGELAESNKQTQKAIDEEAAARTAEDATIRQEFSDADAKLQKALDTEAATRKAQDTDIRNTYATKAELTKAINDLINGADVDSDTLKELANKITALAQADNGLVSAVEAQSFKKANKEIARNNIEAVSIASFDEAVATINNDKATREELAQAKTELTEFIKAKATQLQKAIDEEELDRKSDDTAIRAAFAHADTMVKESLTALINTTDTAIRSDYAKYDQLLQKTIEAEEVVRKVEDAAIRSEFALADQKLRETIKENINVKDAAIRNDFVEADQMLEAAIKSEEVARKTQDIAIRSELTEASQQLQTAIDAEVESRTAEGTAIRGELAQTGQQLQAAINAEEEARKAEDAAIRSEYATKDELTQAITDLINGADADSDTLKELADKITALAQADNGLVSATKAQSFKEANKEIARKNIDAVSKAVFDETVTTINSTKSDRAELAQAKTELAGSIQTQGAELQAAISAEEQARTAADTAIRGEFAQADQKLEDAVNAADAAIRSEFAKADQQLQEAISTEEEARKVESAAIRSEFAQADQALKQAVDAEDVAIRGELAKAEQQLQAAIGAEKSAREEAETAINEQIAAKADKAPEGEEYALVSAIPDLAPYATKDELTQAITDLINGADADSDTLKELADKIIALAQADNGLVSATEAQTFDNTKKEIARNNIDAVSTTAFDEALATINDTNATRKELGQAKTELAESIQTNANELLEAIGAEETARTAEDAAIREELAKTDQQIKDAIAAIPEPDLTPFATKVELTQAITDLINGADADADTLKELADKITALAQADNGLVGVTQDQGFTEEQKAQGRSNLDAVSTADLESQRTGLLGGIATAIEPLATKEQLATKADKAPEGEQYAYLSSLPDLAPYATKVELTKAVTDLINGADADSDTLKELADKITALAQADNGLVNATQAQSFTVEQQKQARTNIAALAEEDIELGEGYAEYFTAALDKAIAAEPEIIPAQESINEKISTT